MDNLPLDVIRFSNTKTFYIKHFIVESFWNFVEIRMDKAQNV